MGIKDTFWHWEWGPISAPKLSRKGTLNKIEPKKKQIIKDKNQPPFTSLSLNFSCLFQVYPTLRAEVFQGGPPCPDTFVVRIVCDARSRGVTGTEVCQPTYWITEVSTVLILSFRTVKSRQTVQTQVRLLLKEQSDQGPLFVIPLASFGQNTLRFDIFVWILGRLQQRFF